MPHIYIFGWQILNSFGTHLGFVVTENFADHDGVVEVSMVEAHNETEGLRIGLLGFFGGFKKHERKQRVRFQIFC
jgi:hypothetical protein